MSTTIAALVIVAVVTPLIKMLTGIGKKAKPRTTVAITKRRSKQGLPLDAADLNQLDSMFEPGDRREDYE